MSSSRDEQPLGLRERKKARTRAAIQSHALRLFTAQGYAETTIEQIAAAAEVSQSTFFRYFPTKEDTVLYDRLDPVLMRAFVEQPAELTPLQAVRAACAQVFARLDAEESELERARQRLVFSVPELRNRMIEHIAAGLGMLAEAAAERAGRDPGDFTVRVWSGAVIGVVFAAYFSAAEAPENLVDVIDKAVTLLEDGLPL
ncbi:MULTISPECIES: TetR family transcriptional regulator [Amycolatopsis]|uniref:acyl-CoA-like ligand-binding transcription factor n=1 Tax=Amycolatopsis TaxID=1813 RepID=UPI0002628225|nr:MULTISPECIES: TetR family transcriptional regulator [Amycolatopsis]MCF6422091.1 TetR family transcriptional regulator [Amycolatopsis tucumanensis]